MTFYPLILEIDFLQIPLRTTDGGREPDLLVWSLFIDNVDSVISSQVYCQHTVSWKQQIVLIILERVFSVLMAATRKFYFNQLSV